MCLLVGHDLYTQHGAGQYRDQEFLLCRKCDYCEPVIPERAPDAPKPQRAAPKRQ